ncbi:hypothetical protein NKG05_07500 [Oerskovia sp. M15]
MTAQGVTLPAGAVFRDGGHVNYRATALDGTGATTFGTHFEALNSRPSGVYIGTGSYDFSAAVAAFPDGYCVSWVQVAGYDEHFGEGGQGPVCTPTLPAVPTDEERGVPGRARPWRLRYRRPRATCRARGVAAPSIDTGESDATPPTPLVDAEPEPGAQAPGTPSETSAAADSEDTVVSVEGAAPSRTPSPPARRTSRRPVRTPC